VLINDFLQFIFLFLGAFAHSGSVHEMQKQRTEFATER